jgi:RNA-binding protein
MLGPTPHKQGAARLSPRRAAVASLYNPCMTLTPNQKKHLRRLAHGLDPVVLVGQHGLTPGVAAELDGALAVHELVKVRARTGDRQLRDEILSKLAETTSSELVFQVGNVGVFYRKNKELSKILLPDN